LTEPTAVRLRPMAVPTAVSLLRMRVSLPPMRLHMRVSLPPMAVALRPMEVPTLRQVGKLMGQARTHRLLRLAPSRRTHHWLSRSLAISRATAHTATMELQDHPVQVLQVLIQRLHAVALLLRWVAAHTMEAPLPMEVLPHMFRPPPIPATLRLRPSCLRLRQAAAPSR